MSVLDNQFEKIQSSQPEKTAGLASLPDRAAAFLVDCGFLVLFISLVTAPFKRNLDYADLNEDVKAYLVNYCWIILLTFCSIIIYQTLMIWLRGGTIGKLIFKIRVVNMWTAQNPKLTEALLRSVSWVFSVIPLGLPFLEIMSNPQRRSLHDRINDTVVVSISNRQGMAPSREERALVHSVYSFFLALVFIACAVEIKSLVTEFSTFNDFFGYLSESDFACEEVTEAQKNWPQASDVKEQRLNIALALYATDAIDEACLDVEARRTFYFKENLVSAYLAKAFSTADDSTLSDGYLHKVCEVDSQSEECELTKIIVLWTEKKWDDAAEVFRKLEKSEKAYVKIWAIKHQEKNKDYSKELETIEGLWPNSVLKGYLGSHATVALWGAHRKDEARQAFLGVYDEIPSDQQESFSRWMCDSELEDACGYKTASCSAFYDAMGSGDVAEDTEDAASVLTYIKSIQCQPDYSKVLAQLKLKIEDPNLYLYIQGLQAKEYKKKYEANQIFENLLKEVDADPQFAYEVRRQSLELISRSDELEEITKQWRSEQTRSWYWLRLGQRIFKKYIDLNQHMEAAKVGKELLEIDPYDSVLRRDVVVALFKGGKVDEAKGLADEIRRSIASTDEFDNILMQMKRTQ